VPNLTVLLMGSYLAVGALQVLNGKISLGSFLATLGVYKDLGDRTDGVYANLRSSLSAIVPLLSLVKMLHLPTELHDRFDRQSVKTDYMHQCVARKDEFLTKPTASLFDEVPFRFEAVSFNHIKSISEVSAVLPQGKLCFLTGSHGSGKATFLNAIMDNETPDRGHFLCPSHLRVIQVTMEPAIIAYMSLYQNLTFGCPPKERDPQRVRRICRRVGVKGELLRELDRDIATLGADGTSPRENSEPYASPREVVKRASPREVAVEERPMPRLMEQVSTSNSERKRIHLVRAFVFNPEVMGLHTPVDELDTGQTDMVLALLREFVDERGVEIDRPGRRPRSVFFTGGNVQAERLTQVSDVVWELAEQGLIVRQGGGCGPHEGYREAGVSGLLREASPGRREASPGRSPLLRETSPGRR